MPGLAALSAAALVGRKDMLDGLDFRQAPAAEREKCFIWVPITPLPASLSMKLRIGVLLHGVDIQGCPGAPVAAAHNLVDMEKTVEAFQQTIKQLQAEGELD